MELTSFYQYYDLLSNLLFRQDWKSAEGVSKLLSFRDSHSDYIFLHVPNPEIEYGNRNVMEWATFDELVILHIYVLHFTSLQDWIKAVEAQMNILQTFNREVLQKEKETNWFMPILYTFCTDLRLLARAADSQKVNARKASTFYEDVASPIMESYRICVAESRLAAGTTKKIGILNLTNQLFRIYFKINRLHLLRPLIRSIDHVGDLYENFSLADRITYNYFLGRKAMFDMDLKKAEESLSFAFQNCPGSYLRNKRLILMYLIPVKMFLGHMPSKEMLEYYNLTQFYDVVSSVKEGNIRELNESLQKNQHFFIKCGIFLMLEKLKVITYRNLFKKITSLLGSHLVKLDAFLVALKYLGSDLDLDELSCIVAILIAQKKIKGYISYQKQTLVVSKQEPFPPLSLN